MWSPWRGENVCGGSNSTVVMSHKPSAITNLLVLVGRHGDELGLFEDERPDARHLHRLQVLAAGNVQPWLVLVHGVQHRL